MNKGLNFRGDRHHQSGICIRIRIRIHIATLIRRALAEVCTVPVLLVIIIIIIIIITGIIIIMNQIQNDTRLYW